MAKIRKREKSVARLQKFGDGFTNPVLRVGENQGNAFTHGGYRAQNVTFNRQELEWAYVSSWVVARSIDAVAEDMTREGVDITGVMPEQESAIHDTMARHGVWDSICDALKWARLYGGALGIVLIEGEDLSKPLDVSKVRRGSFRGVFPVDRWQVTPSPEVVTELGAEFGKPLYYTIMAGGAISAPGGATLNVHHSRVIRLIGRKLPWQLEQQQQGWGASVLETLWDAVRSFDLATKGMGQLIQKAHLRFYQIEGLRDVLAMGKDSAAYKGIMRQFDLIREMQSIEGLTVGDKEDSFSTQSYSFGGLPDVVLSFAQHISGATQIPLVRLLGQSPAGLNSTGESDLRTYYDSVRLAQTTTLEKPLQRLFGIVWRSTFGEALPREFAFSFKPLWQLNDEQKAAITAQVSASVIQALEAGTIDRATALRELKSLSEVTNVFTSITDEAIDEADREETELMPPEAMEVTHGNEEPIAPEDGAGGDVVQAPSSELGQ